MRTLIRVRELTAGEAEAVKRLAHSRKEPGRRVQRAKVVWPRNEGKLVSAIAAKRRVNTKIVRV
jgi:hypothetical protein